LRVAPVREHGLGGEPTPMAVHYVERPRSLGPLARAVSCVGPRLELRPIGTYCVVICAGCQDTRWYARELDPETAAPLGQAAVGACLDCGEARSIGLGPARTRGPGGQPSELRILTRVSRRWGFSTTEHLGRFSTFACRGCGRTSWIAGGLEPKHLAEHGRPAQAPCVRCTGTRRFVVEPVNEGGATLRVVYDKQHLRELRIGCYSLSICTDCGVTDWSARDLESLRPDAQLGVEALSVGEGHEGPYR